VRIVGDEPERALPSAPRAIPRCARRAPVRRRRTEEASLRRPSQVPRFRPIRAGDVDPPGTPVSKAERVTRHLLLMGKLLGRVMTNGKTASSWEAAAGYPRNELSGGSSALPTLALWVEDVSSYCTDTAYDPGMIASQRRAPFSSTKPGTQTTVTIPPHIRGQATGIAREADAGRLVLIHVRPRGGSTEELVRTVQDVFGAPRSGVTSHPSERSVTWP
jgi:hypothetical protein